MSDLKRSLSLKLLLGGLSGAIAVLAVAGPAQAQFFGGWGYMPYQYRMMPDMDGGPVYLPRRFRPVMSPGDIRMFLSEEGYQVIGGLQVNGRVYIANVRDRRGQGFRLVVDGIEGNVLQRFARATPSRPPEALARGPMGDEEYFDPPRLPPPSVTPPSQRAPRAEPAPRRAAPPAASARREPPARTVVRPDGGAVATRPPQERVTKVAPDDGRSVVAPTVARPGPGRPEVAKPDVAKPELVKPAEAKPEAVKPAAPVAEAVRPPRVVYPDAAQTKPPVETMPAAPSDGAGLKPTPPLSSVPVAPLE
jgi:hypothetical protein